MHTSSCVVCGAEFQHKQKRTKYCSKDCGAKASYERRRDAGTFVKTCTEHDGVCERCGTAFRGAKVRGKPRRFCSATCSALAASAIPRTPEQLARPGRQRPKRPMLTQCDWCHALHIGSGVKFCSAECRERMGEHQALQMRGPLRVALESGDHIGVIAAVRERSTVTPSGCWEWAGMRNRNGYPVVRFSRRSLAVHRLVVEAKHGAPLGSQAAHHKCANTSCVNPDHLEPATFADNTLEMMSRQAYVARIAELEAALALACPSHPLIHRIQCA